MDRIKKHHSVGFVADVAFAVFVAVIIVADAIVDVA